MVAVVVVVAAAVDLGRGGYAGMDCHKELRNLRRAISIGSP